MTKVQAIAAALVAAFLFGGVSGAWLHGLLDKAATVDEVQQQAQADAAQASRTSDAVQTNAEAKAKTEIRYVTVTKEIEKLVERPVYLERCIDDDGLRALNAQILGFDPAEPGSAVPAD